MQAHTAIQIANWFIDRASRDGEVLTNLKLQKLVHIANGWHLHFKNEPLFGDDVEAWPYGPVIPAVYHAFKSFGAGAVTEVGQVPVLTGDTLQIVESVWNSYGKISAITLVGMTHKPGSPWSQTVAKGLGQGTVIPRDSIKMHYDELATRFPAGK